EVADDARFVQATQKNMAGTGIATFSDRSRDAVRGGGGGRRRGGGGPAPAGALRSASGPGPPPTRPVSAPRVRPEPPESRASPELWPDDAAGAKSGLSGTGRVVGGRGEGVR
ncbi:hypothetical protein ACFUVU_14670, partial [Streptomyces griseoincarnatus]